MVFSKVLIRFYKSFNYDYLRKVQGMRKRDWETIDGAWFPFVEIPMDPSITAIVGANESGKSHLLSAIRKGLSGNGIVREDFCRYSDFYRIGTGRMKWPDFGFEFSKLTAEEKTHVGNLFSVTTEITVDSFTFIRTDVEEVSLYTDGQPRRKLTTAELGELLDILPSVFELDSSIELPNSVPIKFLAQPTAAEDGHGRDAFSRSEADRVLNTVETHQNELRQPTPGVSEEFKRDLAAAIAPTSVPERESRKFDLQLQLVRKLLWDVAKIDQEAFSSLHSALKAGHEGHAQGIIDKINFHLSSALNFPHYWVQDTSFQLKVSARDRDLVFTIRDRTKTEYSFIERSSGLKYFLSYYVQYLAHKKSRPSELLMMDEPDAYLSSQAQQDLLKILEAFAFPEELSASTQVVYVTHSPYLLDRNHSERIRVLDKGKDSEGTRVVKNVSRNHYEPLRSAFGSQVGETTFIGNCNLIVEGASDQIFVAGVSHLLRSVECAERERLDLNKITLVPAGGAPSVPYLVYLARGRDEDKPAVVVLLDGDKPATDTAAVLRKGIRNNRIIDDRFVLQLGGTPSARKMQLNIPDDVSIEDLIPPRIAVVVGQKYCRDVIGDDTAAGELREEDLLNLLGNGMSTLESLNSLLKKINPIYHIDKIPFARIVIDVTTGRDTDELSLALKEDFEILLSNFRALFFDINHTIRTALITSHEVKIADKITGLKRVFQNDHKKRAKKEDCLALFESIEQALDNSIESDAVRNEIRRLSRNHALDVDVFADVADFDRFIADLDRLQYLGRLMAQDDSSELATRSSLVDPASDYVIEERRPG